MAIATWLAQALVSCSVRFERQRSVTDASTGLVLLLQQLLRRPITALRLVWCASELVAFVKMCSSLSRHLLALHLEQPWSRLVWSCARTLENCRELDSLV